MEIVIVQIVKGKECELTSNPLVPVAQVSPIRSAEPFRVQPILNEDTPVKEARPIRPAKPIIPPEMLSMMIPPDHSLNERFGAKEERRA